MLPCQRSAAGLRCCSGALAAVPSVELKAVADETSNHRLGFLRRLGTPVERVARASFDGEALRLPESLAVYPAREANAALYVWLAACAAHAGTVAGEDDPLLADLAAIEAAQGHGAGDTRRRAGLRADSTGTCVQHFSHFGRLSPLPAAEAAVEALIRHHLG